MPAILTLCLVTAAIIGALFCTVRTAHAAPPAAPKDTAPVTPPTSTASLSREQLSQKLAELEKKPAPKPTPGAMCYAPVRPPDRAEYLCTACGEKSLYTNDEAVVWLVAQNLDAMRKSFAQLSTNAPVKLALDESALCIKCSPTSTERGVALVVTYPDGTTRRTPNVSLSDLGLLDAFFSGKLSITSFNDSTTPLKDSLPRLRELLGVVPKPEKKK